MKLEVFSLVCRPMRPNSSLVLTVKLRSIRVALRKAFYSIFFRAISTDERTPVRGPKYVSCIVKLQIYAFALGRGINEGKLNVWHSGNSAFQPRQKTFQVPAVHYSQHGITSSRGFIQSLTGTGGYRGISSIPLLIALRRKLSS